jgi:hypothetical protein
MESEGSLLCSQQSAIGTSCLRRGALDATYLRRCIPEQKLIHYQNHKADHSGLAV